MKKIALIFSTIITIVSCSPSKKDVDAPTAPTNLKYAVTQKNGADNVVYLQSQTQGVIPYWIYPGGTSRLANDTVIFPFSGDYTIKYRGSVLGNYAQSSDSVKVHVSKTNLNYIKDPQWAYLTNTTGKTWALDMTKPIGWYGADFMKHNGSSDDWSWTPDYKGNEWVMPNMNYGTMRFDLNGGKNYSVHRIDVNGNVADCSGSFDMSVSAGKMTINGCGLLFGGNYYTQVSSWNNIYIITVNSDYMILGVARTAAAGGGFIGFRFIPQ